MATNELLAIATSGGANVNTQAEYAALAAILADGFPSGVVDSQTFNKVLRQTTLAAAMLGKFTADASGLNVVDDGSPANFEAQFLAALRSANVFTTPAQFDTSTKAATMAAVQRALGNSAGALQLSANTVLTKADMGKAFQLPLSGKTITIPAATVVDAGANGATLRFVNNSNGSNTITAAGGIINVGTGGGASLVLGSGDNVDLVAVDGANWFAVSGSASLRNNGGDFGSSLGASGWRRLPSGDIEQWGSVTTSAAGDVTFTFPTAFPTAVYSVTGTTVNSTTRSSLVCIGAAGLSSVPVGGFLSTTGARIAEAVNIRAIGK